MGNIELSTGVKLRLFRPNAKAVLQGQDAFKHKYPEPKIPMSYSEDKGRNEENPNDPDYIQAVQEWQARLVLKTLDIIIAYGTKLEHVPEDVPGDDSEEFEGKLAMIGQDVPSNSVLRYVEWVTTVACGNNDDTQLLTNALLELAGATEEDVQQALESFRGPETKQSDSTPGSVSGSEYGNNHREPIAWDSSSVRAERSS